MFDYDAELTRYNVRLREAADVHTDDRVLDIGCGTGLTTREAARSATSGSALGVDLSPQMLDRARERSEEEAIPNIGFALADAQVHPFPPGEFHAWAEPVRHDVLQRPGRGVHQHRTGLRPGARLVQVVWQAYDRQEWTSAVRGALTGTDDPVAPAGLTHAAFSLADPTVATGILTAAGFTAVEVTEAHEPIYYGPDAAGARDALAGLGMVDDLVADMDATEKARALERLMDMLDAHDTGEGVWFDSRAWLVTALRP